MRIEIRILTAWDWEIIGYYSIINNVDIEI